MAAFGAAARQYATAAGCTTPLPKTMHALTLATLGLVGSFHIALSIPLKFRKLYSLVYPLSDPTQLLFPLLYHFHRL